MNDNAVYQAAVRRAAEFNAKRAAIPQSAKDALLNGDAKGLDLPKLDQQMNARRIYDEATVKHNRALQQVRVTQREVEAAARVLGLEVPSSTNWLEV